MVHVFIFFLRAKNFVIPNEKMTKMNLRRKETFKETPFSICQKLISKEDIKTTTVCFALKKYSKKVLQFLFHQNHI